MYILQIEIERTDRCCSEAESVTAQIYSGRNQTEPDPHTQIHAAFALRRTSGFNRMRTSDSVFPHTSQCPPLHCDWLLELLNFDYCSYMPLVNAQSIILFICTSVIIILIMNKQFLRHTLWPYCASAYLAWWMVNHFCDLALLHVNCSSLDYSECHMTTFRPIHTPQHIHRWSYNK